MPPNIRPHYDSGDLAMLSINPEVADVGRLLEDLELAREQANANRLAAEQWEERFNEAERGAKPCEACPGKDDELAALRRNRQAVIDVLAREAKSARAKEQVILEATRILTEGS